MQDAEYGYVGKGQRIHIVRTDSTTYCERTISERVADPEQVDPGELCKTCLARREEAEEAGTGNASGNAEQPAETRRIPEPEGASAASESVNERSGEGMGIPGPEAIPLESEERGERDPLHQWDRMMALCEEKLGGLCAPILLVGLVALVVLGVEIVDEVGLFNILLLVLLAVGGSYAYLRATGQSEKWDRLRDTARTIGTGIRQRLNRLLP
ncbi:hypothetical protein [Thiohalorhabdus methylotrophus]|uniref:Uncharacterized protein n=1 Tax=Thiohalorhabdus methylotrophus TaxID=3242694 RepID=A0ABV4TTZ6_9GAMM